MWILSIIVVFCSWAVQCRHLFLLQWSFHLKYSLHMTLGLLYAFASKLFCGTLVRRLEKLLWFSGRVGFNLVVYGSPNHLISWFYFVEHSMYYALVVKPARVIISGSCTRQRILISYIIFVDFTLKRLEWKTKFRTKENTFSKKIKNGTSKLIHSANFQSAKKFILQKINYILFS